MHNFEKFRAHIRYTALSYKKSVDLAWTILAKIMLHLLQQNASVSKISKHMHPLEDYIKISVMLQYAQTRGKLLENQPVNPLIWKRYIDNVFAIGTDTREILDDFLKQLNEHHERINEVSSTSIDFLNINYNPQSLENASRTKEQTPRHTHYQSAQPPTSTQKAVNSVTGKAK